MSKNGYVVIIEPNEKKEGHEPPSSVRFIATGSEDHSRQWDLKIGELANALRGYFSPLEAARLFGALCKGTAIRLPSFYSASDLVAMGYRIEMLKTA
jgi:hypothetical protein